ncbi:MAG: ATP-dependent DNA helicase [Pseudomonadota bacterium]
MRLAVRELAERVHRTGDIHVRFERTTTAAEGIQAQREAQAERGATYAREAAVEHRFHVAGREVVLRGRADGFDPAEGLVEEFKATRNDVDRVHAHLGKLHFAQLLLYGALLSRTHTERTDWTLALIYCHPDSGARSRFERRADTQALEAFFEDTIARFSAQLEALLRYRATRNLGLNALEFPYGQFRKGQRALAARSFEALRDGRGLLLEAATGSGKTMAMLFPALKAIARTDLERVLYVTNRTTGALAARSALGDLPANTIRGLSIVARERVCPVEGMPCDPQGCKYAAGYYDRVDAAVEAVWARGCAPPDVVAQIAEAHCVCPFELSLDASVGADVVIMDSNYVFDPTVRLQRFADVSDAAVLIDEAHQLDDRVRAMLSVELDAVAFRRAAAHFEGHTILGKALRSLQRSFSRALKATPSTVGMPVRERDSDVAVKWPGAFNERVSKLLDVLAQELAINPNAQQNDFFLDLWRWDRAQQWLNADDALAVGDASRARLRLVCLDPAPFIGQRLADFGANLRFSGTLSPLPLYRTLHGTADADIARATPTGAQDNLALLLVSDLPTYYRARERTLPRLVDLVHSVVSARAGNYFVALPSFSYLERFSAAFAERHPNIDLAVQQRGEDSATREAFVARFQRAEAPLLGCVVLGGIYTESIDYVGDALLGMVIVSVGLPPPSPQLDAISAWHDARELDGESVVYRRAAMIRIVQAAGRVLRRDSDRGVVCLVDERFSRPEFRQFQPPHWQPRQVASTEVTRALTRFWSTTDHSTDEPVAAALPPAMSKTTSAHES